MAVILVLSIFITSFLFLITIASFFSHSATESKEEEIRRPAAKLSFKDVLKDYNQKLLLLLVRKKKSTKRKDSLEKKLTAAGLPMKAEEFMIFHIFAVLISGGLAQLIFQSIGAAFIGGLVGFIFPKVWLTQKQRKRLKQFNDMLPDMLATITGSLRAGFSFPQSLQMVGAESFSPMKEEVQLVLKEMQYGSTLEEALNAWTKRMPSKDLELLVEAIVIQRQVGGNLAYLFDKIVETTRERTRIENQVKTLTAQGRLSGIIISLLPLGLGMVIYLMNPEYITTLFTHPIGQVMLIAAGISGILGFILVRKITRIEV
ncbi:type II secretion system F family protein [Alteribacillus sp. YIM 98480]|uniref:type II secretion system F family protein n=1 Tax=Alteribacillus sp. YIM 98480 TaxID=2606599 RepID=UPI00131CAECF|nr:type II secretion system F family protein [Alteribacillus sp. YIM 98480]